MVYINAIRNGCLKRQCVSSTENNPISIENLLPARAVLFLPNRFSPMEEENFDNLPAEERCVHKSWKARISGYTSLVALFDDIPDERSDKWNKYVSIVKNVLLDNNDPALEKGLEVVLKFVLKAGVAAKIVGPVVAGLVKKCVASSRARTRDLALLVCLACIEIEQQKIVTEELLKGTEAKNPKIPVGCIHILTEIIRAFGTSVIPVEGILRKLPVLLEDKDQNLRNEAKGLTVELYRWLGNDLRTNLLKPEILKPQKLAEIVAEIAKLKNLSAVPVRFLRSQESIQPVDVSGADDLANHKTFDDQIVESHVKDPLNDLKPVEIVSRIPQEFYTQVKSPKWLERKEALENLEKMLQEVERIQNDDFRDIFNTIVNLISKDTNITVVCLAVKCVTLFAQKLGTGFTPYSLLVFRALLGKLKEKKPSVVQTLRDALEAVFKSSTIDLFIDDLSESLKSKNPNVKSESALFLSQCFSRLSATSIGKKTFKPLFSALVTCLSDQDPCVRDQSSKALGVALGVFGEKELSVLLKDLEKTKLSKIKESAESFLQASSKLKTGISFHTARKDLTNPKSDSSFSVKKPTEQYYNENIFVEAPKVKKTENTLSKAAKSKESNSSCNSKESIHDLISGSTMKELSDKDWSVRMHAVSELQKVVNSVSNLSPDLGEIGPLLSSRVLDSNPKISAASINLVKSLAEKVGPPFSDNLRIILPALLKAVSDVKGPVREVATNCLTKICESCGYSEVFRTEFLPESLKSGSNTAKAKLWHWLAEHLPKITTKDVSKGDLENILPSLFSSLEDKSAEVRSEASNALEGFLRVLSLGTVISSCEKLFGNTNNSVSKIVHDKHKSGLFSPITESSAKLPCKTNTKLVKNQSPMVSHKKGTFDDECEKSPLLDVNNMKNQRIIDEQKHKTPKWDFATPRVEFVELLKGLMSAANFSQELTKMMFHTDFKCHLKAMNLLTEEIPQNSVGIVCNLDLILRWLTLRFFDGNPSVLSKSLDFVITALGCLKETNYCLLDSEATAFMPYLVMKLGDSKENIQTKVKEILVSMTSVYPVSKLKKFVMDGVRSNIARQRANCLDVIDSYINIYGDAVYLKDVDSVCEAVGKLLKDRDPAVKKKAFSVAGRLYEREGEKILKLIERQAGDDFRLIENRIRRYVMAKPSSAQDELKTRDPSSFIPEELLSSSFESSPVESLSTISEPTPEPKRETEPKREVSDEIQPAKFHWDADLVRETDDLANLTTRPTEVSDIDLGFTKGDPKSHKGAFQLQKTKKMLYSPNSSTILSCLESIADEDLIVSKNGMKYIDMMLNSGGGKDLYIYTDLLMQKLTENLEKLREKQLTEVLENYSAAFALLVTLCNEKRFMEQFSEERLHDTLEQLLFIISSNKFSGKDNEVYLKTVNAIILEILEDSRKTPLLCGLLKMLDETREPGGSMVCGKLNILCMKCLWKLNRAQPAWDEELDYGVIFSVIRVFLRGFPSPWWKSRPDDTSLRTVKTMLKTMVKLRGERVWDDVGIDDECELSHYLSKLLNHLKQEGTAKPKSNGMVTKPQNLLPSQAKELSDIFSDIALNSPGAIEKLNEFKRRNPFVDLHKILSTTSPAFLRYFLAITGETDSGGTADGNPTDEGNFSREALQFGLVYQMGDPLCGLKRILIEHAFELSSLLFFILPMSLITVLYVLIGLRLRRSSIMTRESGGSFGHTERGRKGAPPQRHHCSRRVLKMLVAVVVAFFICWAPFHAQRLFSIYYDVRPVPPLVENIYSVVTYISGVLYYLSTTINPILYHIMSLKFREAFKTTIAKCCFAKRRARPYLILSRGKTEPDSGKSGTDSATAIHHDDQVFFRSCSQEISNSSLRRVDRGDLEDELTAYMNELERRQNS